MPKQPDLEMTRQYIAPSVRSDEQLISAGSVAVGLIQFWPIILTFVGISAIAFIPDMAVKQVCIPVLMVISIAMQMINICMRFFGMWQPTLFAVTNQRIVFFRVKNGAATLLNYISLSDIKSLDVSTAQGMSRIQLVAVDRTSARVKKICLYGEANLPALLRCGIEQKTD